MTELWKLDAVDVAERIRTRSVSCTEVMESVVARIRQVNPSLNAIVDDHTGEALQAAAVADRDLLDEAFIPGRLFGVPVTIKVNCDVEGQASPNGLAVLAKVIATSDAPVVKNLRAAGAIIVGRTNAPEMSMRGTTDNPLHGRTYNPWHPDASPGGSSGGAGSAAAAGFGPLHHGNDIGGSLRSPSFCNGVVTVKPTLGRMATFNSTASAEAGLLARLMSTQGIIARSVADVRLATEVMSAGDARDPWWMPVPFHGAPLGRPIRVAVTRNPYDQVLHPGIADAIDRAAGALSDEGYDVVETEPPPIMEAAQGWFSAGITELKLTGDAFVQQFGSDDLKLVFERYYAIGNLLDLAGYRAGLSDRTRILREWSLFLEDHPLVLTPFLLCPTYAWNADVSDEAEFRRLLFSTVYSYGMNFLGLPAGVLPTGLVEGLPAGVQLVGRRFREDVVLDAMQAIESRVGRLVDQLWAREA